MSIIFAKEETRGSRGSQLDIFGGGDLERVFNVVTDDVTNDQLFLAQSGQFPSLGGIHPSHPFATCRGVDYSRRGKMIWEVTASYSTRPENTQEREKRENPNPLSRIAEFEWESTQYNIAVVKDRDGKGVVNSAGDYPDPPPEDWDVRWLCHIEANILSFPNDWFGLAGAVNEAAIVVDGRAVSAEQARIVNMRRSKKRQESFVDHYVLTYTLEIRYETHDLVFPDMGFRIIDNGEQKEIVIKDQNDNDAKPSSPVLLDGNGQVLANPDDPNNTVFMTYHVARVRSFAGLPGIL